MSRFSPRLYRGLYPLQYESEMVPALLPLDLLVSGSALRQKIARPRKNGTCRMACEKDDAVPLYASTPATDDIPMVNRTLVAFKRPCQGLWLTCLIFSIIRRLMVHYICTGSVVQRRLVRCTLFVTVAILDYRR
jgi:hypothetical protein